ncbi:MAG: NepR family anti-sigma factor [Rhodospirillales bacterium]
MNERADWIGRELRKVFDETVKEAVPDRLTALMSRLRDAEGEGSGS